MVNKVKAFKEECSITINELEKEVDDLDNKIKVYERDFKNNNKEN